MLSQYVLAADRSPSISEVDAHINDKAIEHKVAEAEFRRAYLGLCRQIVSDGIVSDSELEALTILDEKVGPDSQFARAARSDAFRVMYLVAVADHDVDEQEEAGLRHIRERLDVPDEEIAEELAFVEQLKRLRRIRSGEAEAIQTTHWLQKGERCYLQAEGRFLKEKQLRSYTQDGQRYKIRGLMDDREGTLLITNRRVPLIHSGTSGIRQDKVSDVTLMSTGMSFELRRRIECPDHYCNAASPRGSRTNRRVLTGTISH